MSDRSEADRVSDDLVERVAQQFSHLHHLSYEYGKRHTWSDYARAAIAVLRPALRAEVLEEAARVCERRYMGDNNREDMEARRCAAAIRALVKEHK